MLIYDYFTFSAQRHRFFQHRDTEVTEFHREEEKNLSAQRDGEH